MKALPYGTLSQRNPNYDEQLHEELEGLYRGGYSIQRCASKYLPQIVGEHASRWKERCASTAFVGYTGQVIDYYAASLFKQPLSARPNRDETPGKFDPVFYEALESDVDLSGSSLVEFMRRVFTTALTHKRGLVGVDFPRVDGQAVSLADEDASGAARAYLLEIDPESLIDWEYDEKVRVRSQIPGNGVVEFDVGRFKWCILRRVINARSSPASARGDITEEFKVWQRADDGSVVWSLYRITYNPERPPRPTDDVPMVDFGVVSFDAIPIVELLIPDGLWVGNKIGLLNKEHWQRRSVLNASENRGLVAIPYVKLGSALGSGGAIPAEVQQDEGRGDSLTDQLSAKGYMVLGADDEVGFAAPDGMMHDSTETRIGKLVDEIFRVVHLMAHTVSSTAKSVGRSGASKQEDRWATTVILNAYGAIVRDFARRIYETIASGRKEPVVWVVHGLDKFDNYDRDEILAEALAVDQVSIPSDTFKKLYKTELASRLAPNAPPEVAAKIEAEIDKGVDDASKAAAELKKQFATAPMAPAGSGQPGQQGPQEKTNVQPSNQRRGPGNGSKDNHSQ